MRVSKYYAKKVELEGFVFDSESESRRYKELKELEKQGFIENIEVHPVFCVQDEFEKNDVVFSAINYEADFRYINKVTKKKVVEDVKGFYTDEFKILRKLFEYCYMDLSLTVLKEYKGVFVTEQEYKDIKNTEKQELKLKRDELKKECLKAYKEIGKEAETYVEKISNQTKKYKKEAAHYLKQLELLNKNKEKEEKLENKKKEGKKLTPIQEQQLLNAKEFLNGENS